MLSSLLASLIFLLVVGCIAYLLFWAIGKIGLPEPFSKIAMVIVVIFVVIVLLDFLLGFTGQPFTHRWR